MKILVIHNYHRKGSASGDDQVFKNETALLEKKGHQVIRYTTRNDLFDQASLIGKIKYMLGMKWSKEHYKKVDQIIKDQKPDIVHVHTFFPLLSPSILYAAKKNKCKVVATLHDTRFICPCATSLRNNNLCNECKDGRYFRMCKYKCFKNSFIQSFIVASVFHYHRKHQTFYNQIDRYICLNDNQIELLKATGFDMKKITKKYNFVEDNKNVRKQFDESLPKRFVCFYGRIGEEKGIRVLMKIWDKINGIPLVVMGDGPLEKEFALWAETKDNVYFKGYVDHDKCLSIVKASEFVVFPSIWYEGCSMVEIETQNLGKPIIATDLGFSAEAIVDGYNGLKVKLGDINGFCNAVKKLWDNPELLQKMEKNSRKEYEKKYTPNDNYRQLMNIYQLELNKEINTIENK
ncbi:MAG: glycosyltransferase family 4 protein [Coriobacteriales bacterium]|jgi:glycosyltransferase involved in cell wall biosynthesis